MDQFGERLAATNNDVHEAKGGKQAVARRGVSIAKNNVSRLFSTQRGARLQHFLKNIFVADVGAKHADARASECDLQAHVRHGCRNNGVCVKGSLRLHVAGGRKQNRVSVDDASGRVAEERAISITVERNSEIELSAGLRNFPAQSVGMKSA